VTGHRHDGRSGADLLEREDEPRRLDTVRAILDPLWRRLQAMDVINRGMMFAAVLLLCFVPFCIVLQAAAGQSAAARLSRRYGLDDAASHAVGQVFASPTAASTAMTVASWIVLVVFAIGAAATLQELYVASFDVERPTRGSVVRCCLWIAALIGTAALGAVATPWLGGGLLIALAAFVVATGFFWFTMWLLLADRVSWRDLYPSAVATGAYWVGMQVVFRLTMSDMITSNFTKYGAIGVVFTLMTLMVAVGVVVILGAITGIVWRERHAVGAQR
jgi:membrane protein